MKLKVYLATMDMTLKDLSRQLDCNFSYLSRIMNGKIVPGKRLAKDIEHITNGQVKFSDKKMETAQRI
jgi:transcriptional regulator with XRE-family HTH domain